MELRRTRVYVRLRVRVGLVSRVGLRAGGELAFVKGLGLELRRIRVGFKC